MATTQRRLLTAPNSKLTKSDLVRILRKEDSWMRIPHATREELYALLPAPRDGEGPHNPDVHPLQTKYKPYIEEELRRFRDDLKDGREQKKWREEAMQAGKDRAEGKFDELKEGQRDEYRGQKAGKEDGDVNGHQGEVDGGKVGCAEVDGEKVGESVEIKGGDEGE